VELSTTREDTRKGSVTNPISRAIGNGCECKNQISTAIGNDCECKNHISTAIGNGCECKNPNSTATEFLSPCQDETKCISVRAVEELSISEQQHDILATPFLTCHASKTIWNKITPVSEVCNRNLQLLSLAHYMFPSHAVIKWNKNNSLLKQAVSFFVKVQCYMKVWNISNISGWSDLIQLLKKACVQSHTHTHTDINIYHQSPLHITESGCYTILWLVRPPTKSLVFSTCRLY
jgi:hypothetical protein